MKLTEYLEDKIYIRGNAYDLDFTFDNILRVNEIMEDETLRNHIKIDNCFTNLVKNCYEQLSYQEKSDIISYVMKELLKANNVDEQFEEEEQEDTPQTKTHDLVQDAELIYASFLYDYNIDLFEQQGKMHWKKFIALLNGLSEDSIFKKVVHIRVKPIPKETKHNKEDVRNLRKLKRLYSLNKSEENAVKEIDNAFDSLGEAFKKSAK